MITERPMGGFERQRMPARLVAAREIAQAEHDASAARALSDGDEYALLTHEERVRSRAIHQSFYELVELQGVADDDVSIVLELFAENAEIANATLRRIEMNGDWSAADTFERELPHMLYDTGYESLQRIPRHSPEAKIDIIIPAGFTKEYGFVALRRKRRLIIAGHRDSTAIRPALEVDKISTFALDIDHLAALSESAVSEVRLIVAMTMYNAIDWAALAPHRDTLSRLPEEERTELLLNNAKRRLSQDSQATPGHAAVTAFNDAMRLARTMAKYNMTTEALSQRLYGMAHPSALQGEEAQAFVENALQQRSDLLTPAATMYYVHS